jgi:hypothetical protein
MKVKCLSDRVGNIRYRFTVGKEYVVLGISHSVDSEVTHLWIKDDPGNYFVPTSRDLFEIAAAHDAVSKLEDEAKPLRF